MKSLRAFIGVHGISKTIIRCGLCLANPTLLKEIHDERKREPMLSAKIISEYLATKGVRISDAVIQNHFREKHECRKRLVSLSPKETRSKSSKGK